MDFDFTTETITPDSTTLLTIGGGGALELPSGTTGQQPAGSVAGAVRWNTTVPQLEYFNGTLWLSFGGTVTSVTVTGANGIGSTGSPITSSGTIALTLGAITPTSINTGSGTFTSVTDSTLTANSFLYSGTGGLLTTTTAPTNGQLLIGSTGVAPVAATLTAGTGVSVTNGAGSITIANTGVTSNVAGTGISVSGATGAVTITNTGVVSLTGTASQIIVSSATGAVTLSLPQNISTTSTPTFNQVTITNPPVAGTDTVNLSYLQSQIAGLEWKNVAQAATVAVLAYAPTYSNGASGVGATLTASTNGILAVDGYTVNLGDRVVVKNQAAGLQNGIYSVTTLGTGSVPYVLTRTTDANTSGELNNATLYVTNGTTNGDTGWTQTTQNPTVGTSTVTFVQFSGSGTYTAGTGLTLTGNTFSLTTPVAPALGGTGTTTLPGAGQVLIGTSGSVYAPATIASGSGISTTTGSGTLQINNTGVLSVSGGSTGLTPATATTGVVTLAGTLNLASGGTNASLTASNGAIVYSSATALALSAVGTAGYFLTSGGAGAPTWTNPATSVTTSISFGTTGLTPATATTGAVVVAGTLAVANGGTGLSSTPANGALDIGNGTGFTRTTLTQGTGITITNAAGSITIANAGVTSFNTSLSGLTPSASSTGAVTLAGTLGLSSGGTAASLTAINGGIVYSSGSALAITSAGTTGQYLVSAGAAAPVWTTVTNGGLKLYAENPSSPTAPVAAGTNSVAIGTGATTNSAATNSFAVGLGSYATQYGANVYANGTFATAGDAQTIEAVYRQLTSSNATAEAFLDGSGGTQRMVLPNSSAWTFTIQVAARRTDATGTYGSWIFNGLIYRDASAGTTAIVGLSKTTMARVGNIVAANDPVVSADTTNGSLKVAVTGVASNTIRWVANVRLVQVTN